MRKLVVFALLTLLLVGCGARRVGPLAPRRTDTPDHRAAAASADCVACHALNGGRDHAPDDSCTNCHNLIPGR